MPDMLIPEAALEVAMPAISVMVGDMAMPAVAGVMLIESMFR